jgi:hypothetical protein
MWSSKLTVQIHEEGAAFQEWLAKSGDRTQEEFREKVVRRVSAFCDETERVIRCLLFMPTEAVHVIVGVEPPYDFELSAQIAELELEIAQEGWHYISMLEFPGDGDLGELQNFGRFSAESD